MIEAGGKLGKYELRGTLGRGAMGVVYDGYDPIIARRVAIKTVKLPNADDAEGQEELARFRREAQAAGRLTHPNIVGVYDYGEDQGVAYIVMEFVDGPTLKSLLDKQERMALPDIARVMEDVLSGLAFSHARGIVHRDIKPANVMLTSDGRAKIADFGIARIESSSMTQAGTVMGTPAYMSPEQFMGQTVDARTDLYSSGVLLYQLLTGERPFEGGMTAIMHKALHTEPPRPSDLSVTAPPAMDPVVARAMAKRPEARFPNAEAFAAAMRAALAAPAALAEPSAEATMISAPRAASPAPAPVTPPPAAVASPMVDPTVPVKRGAPVVPIVAGLALLAALGGGAWYMLGGGSPPAPTQVATAPTAPAAPAAPAPPSVATPAPSPTPPVQEPPAVTPAAPPVAPSVVAAEPPVRLEPAAPPAVVAAPPASVAAPPAASPAPVASTQPPTQPAAPVPSTPAIAPPPAATTAQPSPQPAVAAPAAPEPATQFAAPPLAKPVTPVETTPTARPATPSLPPPATAPPVQPPPQALALGPVAPRPPASPPAPPVQPAVLPPASVARAALAAALPSVTCSLVSGTATPERLTLRGVVGQGAPERALREAFANGAGSLPRDWRVASFDAPFCTALDTLRPVAQPFGTPGELSVALAGNATRLRDGELVTVVVNGPDFPAYVYVSFLVHDGTLAHLHPTPTDPSRQLPAGGTLRLGDPAIGGPAWAVSPPFGVDLIIAVASSVPLFDKPRPDDEDTAAYLRDLRVALERARRGGARLASDAWLLDTVAR
ncbi:serine/threonine-protein kinase [Roseomonas sp. AR75]|uniref:serine/threonine-protein kinase n=1 Tax=Roseomonas sp. AR75 TaxID=2562311 RepID=UPI0010BFA610|nr:serine/threonine-protein kinase [Roseomonas sp. AR75]